MKRLALGSMAAALSLAACAAPRSASRPALPAEAGDPALPAARAVRAGDGWGSMAEAVRARRVLDGTAEVEGLVAAAQADPAGPLAIIAMRRLSELSEESPARAAQVDAGVAGLLSGGRLAGVAAYRARVVRALVAETLGEPAAAARYRTENGAVTAWTVMGLSASCACSISTCPSRPRPASSPPRWRHRPACRPRGRAPSPRPTARSRSTGSHRSATSSPWPPT